LKLGSDILRENQKKFGMEHQGEASRGSFSAGQIKKQKPAGQHIAKRSAPA
jgi:hypothetical protein